MKKVYNILLSLLPPILWMVTIFYFSSQPRSTIISDYVLNFIFFKTGHIIEYAILYFLLFRGFYQLNKNSLSLENKLIYPALISFLYAISDEVHQLFIPTREGRLRDVFIDSLGIVLMYIYIKNNLGFVKKLITWKN